MSWGATAAPKASLGKKGRQRLTDGQKGKSRLRAKEVEMLEGLSICTVHSPSWPLNVFSAGDLFLPVIKIIADTASIPNPHRTPVMPKTLYENASFTLRDCLAQFANDQRKFEKVILSSAILQKPEYFFINNKNRDRFAQSN